MASLQDQVIQPTALKYTDIPDGIVMIAHAMVENYLGIKQPTNVITMTFLITDATKPLPALTDYPINQVDHVTDVFNNNQEFIFDTGLIYPSPTWSLGTLIAQYKYGLPAVIHDAIRRQAMTLKQRSVNFEPEATSFDFAAGIKPQYNPMYRTGIASDVKHMLHPYKVIGF